MRPNYASHLLKILGPKNNYSTENQYKFDRLMRLQVVKSINYLTYRLMLIYRSFDDAD